MISLFSGPLEVQVYAHTSALYFKIYSSIEIPTHALNDVKLPFTSSHFGDEKTLVDDVVYFIYNFIIN